MCALFVQGGTSLVCVCEACNILHVIMFSVDVERVKQIYFGTKLGLYRVPPPPPIKKRHPS